MLQLNGSATCFAMADGPGFLSTGFWAVDLIGTPEGGLQMGGGLVLPPGQSGTGTSGGPPPPLPPPPLGTFRLNIAPLSLRTPTGTVPLSLTWRNGGSGSVPKAGCHDAIPPPPASFRTRQLRNRDINAPQSPPAPPTHTAPCAAYSPPHPPPQTKLQDTSAPPAAAQ